MRRARSSPHSLFWSWCRQAELSGKGFNSVTCDGHFVIGLYGQLLWSTLLGHCRSGAAECRDSHIGKGAVGRHNGIPSSRGLTGMSVASAIHTFTMFPDFALFALHVESDLLPLRSKKRYNAFQNDRQIRFIVIPISG